MFGSTYRFVTVLAMAVVFSFNSIVAAPFAKSNESQVNNLHSEGNYAEVTNILTVEESSVLYGTWRASSYTNGMRCNSEVIFQPNGGYSSLYECGNGTYMFHTVGYWYLLQEGAIRIQYTNYSPKEYKGNPIRIPDGETVYYRIINRNQIESSFGMLYRVQ
jgi:hypothetical protein